MKTVIQRVTQASVTTNNQSLGQISSGYLVLVGFQVGDTPKQVVDMIDRLLKLRIMPDQQDKMNLSILDVHGGLLIVPQFTLYADTSSRRPSFAKALLPPDAQKLFNLFVSELKKTPLSVKAGQFGTRMQVSLVNDGPVTFVLEN